MKGTIKENVDNIRDECDEIEGKINPKKVKTYGDPIVQFHE